MQCRWGIQAAFVSSLMKGWCQSVFLVTLPCTHTQNESVHFQLPATAEASGSPLGLGLVASAGYPVLVFFLPPHAYQFL